MRASEKEICPKKNKEKAWQENRGSGDVFDLSNMFAAIWLDDVGEAFD